MISHPDTCLVIVDPQIDFISGSLAVVDGAAAMLYLARLIDRDRSRIGHILVSMDQHPANHCSFEAQGGPWPPHCVRYTEGAAIYPPLFAALDRARVAGIPIEYFEKATTAEADSYSAFSEDLPESLRVAEHIVVAGIAGEYCVRQTILDLERHGLADRIDRIERAIAYINPPD